MAWREYVPANIWIIICNVDWCYRYPNATCTRPQHGFGTAKKPALVPMALSRYCQMQLRAVLPLSKQ